MIPWDRDSGRAARVRERTRRALPWIFVAAMVVNLAMSERYVPASGHPIRTSPSPELSTLVRASQPLTRETYQLYVDLADLAEGATLVVASPDLLDLHLARGLGRVSVEVREYESTIIGGSLDLPSRPLGVVATDDGVVDYWVIPGLPGDTYWVARLDGAVVVVPSSVLAVPEVSS